MRQVLIAILLAAVATPAAAQPTPWSPERFTAGWVFTPAMGLGGVWDSNALVVQEGNPATQELVGSVNPRAEIDFNGKRTRFSAGYSGQLQTYRSIDELTRYSQSGRVSSRYRLTPRLNVYSRQSFSQTPSTDELEIEGLPFFRVGTRVFNAGGGFDYALSRRATLAAAYEFQWIAFHRNQSDASVLHGGHYHNPSVKTSFALTSRVRAGGIWEHSRAELDGGAETYIVNAALGEVEWTVGPDTSVRGAAGIAHLDAVRRDEQRTGPSYRASFRHAFPRVSVAAGYSRTYVPVFGFGGLTSSEVFSASATVPVLHRRMFVRGQTSWSTHDSLALSQTQISLESFRVGGVVGFAASRWLRMEAFVDHKHQTSSARGRVDRARVGIQFVTSKPVRIE
ncbi:MAG: hypothetical protein ACREUC_16330 [Steroidobacteraceae bacterium]